ncbi:MAG: CPBP family glutamic-type intramembrane protease [Isosphaeraceae bacterium]
MSSQDLTLWDDAAGVVAAATAVAIHGVFLGWLRLRSRSLWPSVAAHVANNILVSFMV